MIATERKPLAHWIPGQARNDVGLGLGEGCFWIPDRARNDL